MLPIKWRATARDNLAAIVRYIAQDNVAAARRMRELIEKAIEPAAKHPRMFRRGRVEGTHEIIAHPNYIIVYRVTDTAVEVLRVLHARQEYP